MENSALGNGLRASHNTDDFKIVQVCSVCLCDLTDKNATVGRSHEDMCDQCSKWYDYVELVRVKVHPYIGANGRKFKDEKVMRMKRPAMRCPICGQDAFFQDAGLTTLLCPSCGHRLIQFNNSTVSVWNSILHMPVEYTKQSHIPFFDRSDGTIETSADGKIRCTIVREDSLSLAERVNNILRSIKS